MSFGIGRKAVSGKVLTIVISLVIAMAALIILWVFLQDAMPYLTELIDDALEGFKQTLCDTMPGLDNPLVGWIFGC